MFDRFDDNSRKVIGRARQIAVESDHEFIGTEHILLGLVDPTDSVGDALEIAGVTAPAVRVAVAKLVPRGPKAPADLTKRPLTPRAKRVIDHSVEEADRRGDEKVGTGHLLIGLLLEREGIAAAVLSEFGISLEAARERFLPASETNVERLLATTSPKAPRFRGQSNWRNTLRNLHRDVGFFAVGLTFIYALSGLAVNHINDWDPNYSHYQRLLTVETPLPDSEDAAVAEVLGKLEVEEAPLDVFTFRETIVRYEVLLKDRRVEIQPDRREILVKKQGSEETEVFPLGDPLPNDDWQAATTALGRIGIGDEPLQVHRVNIPIRDITITLNNRDINVQDFGDGYDVIDKGQSPRFFLHAANWLHVNRGKGAWTYIADGYAIALLFLAISGMLMVRGRKGLFGRGGVFLILGISVPVLYLVFAGP